MDRNVRPWPPLGAPRPDLGWTSAAAGLYAASSGLIRLAGGALARGGRRGPWSLLRILLALAVALIAAGQAAHLWGLWTSGLRPTGSGYAAVVYAFAALQAQYVFALVIMGLFTLAKSFAGRLDGVRRQTYDNTMIYPGYGDAALWGLTPLEDQQLAGLIMWAPAGAAYLIAGLAIAIRLIGLDGPVRGPAPSAGLPR